MTWRTIQIQDILDHKQAFSVWFSDHHLNTGQFDNRTQICHLNTRLIQYSDGFYISFLNDTLPYMYNFFVLTQKSCLYFGLYKEKTKVLFLVGFRFEGKNCVPFCYDLNALI